MDYIKYKLVEGYEDYVIFTTSKVFSKKRNKFIKPCKDNKGYVYLRLYKNNKKDFKLHKLLALAFIPNPNNLPSVDHIDQNRQNNNLNNLRWASYKLQGLNRKINTINTSGYKGVSYDKKRNRYRATWIIDNKQKTKSFSGNKYGEDEALRLAIEYRTQMEDKYYKNII